MTIKCRIKKEDGTASIFVEEGVEFTFQQLLSLVKGMETIVFSGDLTNPIVAQKAMEYIRTHAPENPRIEVIIDDRDEMGLWHDDTLYDAIFTVVQIYP